MIKTERLLLIPATVKINKDILDNQFEKSTNYKLLKDFPESKEVYSFFTTMLESDSSLVGWVNWLIINNNYVIGDIGFKGKPDNLGMVEIGYSIVPEFRSKGYATEAAKAIIDWAFSNEAKSIKADTLENNMASISVLEKLKFKRISEYILDNEKYIVWIKDI